MKEDCPNTHNLISEESENIQIDLTNNEEKKEIFPDIVIQTILEPLTVSRYTLPTFGELNNKIKEYVYLKTHDQNSMQKAIIFMTLCMEFYRILMGSLLLSFVPQKCGDHVCSMTENFHSGGSYYIIYILNLMTLISFSFLYLVEIKRENKLITYLDVNNSKPNDAVSVAINLRALPDEKRMNILNIDKIYQQLGCCVIAVFVFNTILSALIIYANYLDNKTVTAFLTNVIFMGCKVSEIYAVANTENNIFFSAYLKNRVQYNDIEQDEETNSEIGQSIISIDCSREEY